MTPDPHSLLESYRKKGLAGALLHAASKSLFVAGDIMLRVAEYLPNGLTPRNVPAHLRKELLRRNRELKDRHAGKRCFTMATGPSLGRQNLARLRGEITIGVNACFRHGDAGKWRPTYYCIHDPWFFQETEESRTFFEELTQTFPETTYMVPLWTYPVVKRNGLLPLEQTHFAHFHPVAVARFHRDPDFTRPLPAAWAVSHFSILLAMYMGCDPIYLLGHDHDWLARGEYVNFHKRHADRREKVGKFTYQQLLRRDLQLWNYYEELDRLARRRGIHIRNATEGGLLDVFERAEYDSLF